MRSLCSIYVARHFGSYTQVLVDGAAVALGVRRRPAGPPPVGVANFVEKCRTSCVLHVGAAGTYHVIQAAIQALFSLGELILSQATVEQEDKHDRRAMCCTHTSPKALFLRRLQCDHDYIFLAGFCRRTSSSQTLWTQKPQHAFRHLYFILVPRSTSINAMPCVYPAGTFSASGVLQ